jgi:hypothetical protein
MTSLAQVTALVDAHVNRDLPRFRAVTLQIAAHMAARSERGAERLRTLVDRHVPTLIPLPSAHGLLSTPPELAALDDMVLAPVVRERLDRVILEHGQRDTLLVHGLRSARKLLFTGSFGVGKTMSAGAIARALGLPMFRVELHEVIGSHLGETASKLSKVFDHVRMMPAVYLFDEFDALGADRSSTSDGSSAGAEMRRTVNSLLQFIEDDRSESLIIAATNHGQMLDRALFRRFDEVIEFPPLTIVELSTLTERALSSVATGPLDYATIDGTNPGLGHADLCAVLDRVRKDYVLTGTSITTATIVDALVRRMRRTEAIS